MKEERQDYMKEGMKGGLYERREEGLYEGRKGGRII